jgi:serine/threonine protein kinase
MSREAQPIPLRNVVPSPLRAFDKYLLVRKLAEGGMAEIFLAKHVGAQGFERDVVIKCMLSQFSGSQEFIDMFLDEARVAARLFHPNIVQITDLGSADGRYFICMEYLAGEDLESIIGRLRQLGRPIPIPLATKIILGSCEGLEFAHSHREGGQPVNLVHRDITPSNILVTFQGTPKVLDFGIAKASSKLVHTQPGTLKGKLGYMSPEQVRGAVLDCRSDIFSLGVTFFELLTGRRVFERDNELGVLMALMEHPVDAPSKHRPEIPEALDRILLKALERKVEDRYATTSELRADLENFLQSQPVPSTTQVGAFVQELFGQSHVLRKTQIPSVKELELEGQQLDTTLHVTAPTFVKPHGTTEEAGLVSAGFQPLPPKPARWPWVLAALTVVSLVAGGLWAWTQRPSRDPLASRVEAHGSGVPDSVAAAPDPTPKNPDPPPTPLEPAPVANAPRMARAVMLTRQDVAQVLQRNTAKILSCGESHRAELPPDGVVKVLFSIRANGTVQGAKVTTDSVTERALGKCLVQRLSALKFPKNVNDPALVIEQPLRFQ